jgi:hypothetical protein
VTILALFETLLEILVSS